MDFQNREKKITIGLPRAFLYARYNVLWKAFFRELGCDVIVSPPTTKATLDNGTRFAIDETCLSTKLYMGHVYELVGKCDYILVPRVKNFGLYREMCTKFESLYDLILNTYRGQRIDGSREEEGSSSQRLQGQKWISYNVDVRKKQTEEKGFREMGRELGFDLKTSAKAYKAAKKIEQADWKEKVRKEEERYKSHRIKILVIAHSYILEDAYIGHPIKKILENLGVLVIRADYVDRKDALAKSQKVSPTLKWELNRELLGSLEMHKKKIDGVVILSAFPCGPDSMVSDMIIRKYPDLPIQNIVLDAQEGTAGLETRLESFTDFLKLRRDEL
ncbi:MAG: acyl-CoA dehydratase activase-related protein [Anaerovoracaceae bacterium]|jgi:predicted nucleotide-binding protein (sugar kinase/HSP70/actin superfamily)